MRKKVSKGIIAAAILTTCLSSPFVSAENYTGLVAPNGAAIDNSNGGTVVVEAGSVFNNNTSTAQNNGGGAIYNRGGDVTIGDGTSFTNNHLNQPVTNTTDREYRSAGGAIASWDSGSLNIGKNVLFSGNGTNSITGKAAWSSGGAIFVDTNMKDLANLTIGSGTRFINNQAGSLGGAVYLGDAKSHITSATFSGNKAGSWGGAIFNAQYFNISGNELSIDGNTLFQNNEAGNYGGAIASQYTTLKVGDASSNITFDGNNAGKDGGAVHISTDADPGYGAVSEFVNTSFVNNKAIDGSGGAIYNPEAQMTITDSSFGTVVNDAKGNITGAQNGNTAKLNGGAISNNGGQVTFNGTNEFAGNSAAQGGAVYTQGKGANVNFGNNATFAYNTATAQGGAVYSADTGTGSTSVGENAKFVGNSSGTQGGAVYNQNSTFEVGANSSFVQNTAKGNGGAIYNAADSSGSASGTINGGTTFASNSSTNLGGAIYNAASIVLNTADGDITFSNNTANGVANDILAAEGSVTSVTGSNIVSIGSGIVTESGSSLSIQGSSNLVIEDGATGIFNGTVTSDDGALLVNNGTTEFAGSFDDITYANVKNNADLTISGLSSSTITNDGNVTVTGRYNGNYTQKDKDSTLTIAKGSKVTVSEDSTAVEGGTVIIEDKNALIGELAVEEAVKLEIQGDAAVIDEKGLKISEIGHIVNTGSGSLNLSGDYLVEGGLLGSSVIISNGSINSINPEGPITIDDKILTLSDNAKSNDGYIIGDDGTLKLAPSAGSSMTLTDANPITGTGEVLVNEVVITKQDLNPDYNPDVSGSKEYIDTVEHKGVGTVIVANDSSGFTGRFVQKMGNVIAQAGSKFFGGQNEVTGSVVTIDGQDYIHNSKLILQDGAVLTSTVAATENANGGYGTIDIYNAIEGEVGEDGVNRISANDIANGIDSAVLTYINSDELKSIQDVNITAAGLGLFNGTRVEGTVPKDSDTLTTQLALAADGGVRDLTFGNGSGSEADAIILGYDTKLTYKDNAYIKDDSTVSVGADASLNFANETTKVEYRPVISSADDSALITKTGAGETVIISTLKDFHGSVEANGGSLDLANTDDISLHNVTANNSNLHIAANVEAENISVTNSVFAADKNVEAESISATNSTMNVANDLSTYNLNVDNSRATIAGKTNVETANFKGSNSVVNLKGEAFFENVNLIGATLNAGSDVEVTDTLTLGKALDKAPTIGLANGGINTVTVGTMDMTESGANIAFDLDPRSQAIDSIIAKEILGDSDSKLLITGINMTRSPIDRNVAIDISNLLQDADGSKADMVALPDGGVISRTAMGDYAITATSSSNMFNAALLAINPQMYRGQVATLASWQNQLVVNNMMFDHMNVLSRQLMDDARTANKYSAILPQFAPYQYSVKDGSLWYKAYGNFERLSMTKGLSVGNNAYGSLIGADFPLVDLKNGWKLVPTAYVAYNGAHQNFDGVSMYQNGAQLGLMGTAYKGDLLTSLLVYGGGYGNDMSVRGSFGSGNDTTGNWFAGVASKTAYNIHLPKDFILQPTAMVTYNAFGNQNWGSNFGAMSMSASMLNGINAAPGFNLIWNKKTFSLYATAQMVYNIMGGVDGRAGNVDLGYVRMRHSFFEYGFGAMKQFKDTFNGYLQMTFRNGGRTGVGFQGGIQWKPGKDKK